VCKTQAETFHAAWLLIPAACCGMVGLKPSYGALSLDGIFPLVPSLDHVGPMARTLNDLALFWQGLTDKAGASDPSLAKRIGFDPAWIDECEPPARNALMDTLSRLQAEGVDCVGLALPPLDKVLEMHSQIFTMEA
jgi:Asp-tRNA(Asn)/Glu-tRNA(Gln) amidotransferase A subunit family amidase